MAVNGNELEKAITLVRGRIASHRDRLKDDEMVTRMALVDPILRVLGWDVADLTRIEVEHNYSRGAENVDYALWANPFSREQPQVKPTGFVEAKKLADPLAYGGGLKCQVDKYRYYTSTVMLTNGDLWKIYRTAPVNFTEGSFSEFRITERYRYAVQKLTELQALLLEPDQNGAPEGYGWVPLAAFNPPSPTKQGMKAKWWQSATEARPGAIKFPDGTKQDVEHWYQLIQFTAIWLYSAGILTFDRTPIPVKPGGKNYFVDRIEKNATPKPIADSGLFVRSAGSDAPELIKALLKHCDQEQMATAIYLQAQR